MKQENKKKTANKWKYAFISLVGLLIGLTLFFGMRIATPRENNYVETTEKFSTYHAPNLQVSTNKEDLNNIISHYLNKYLATSKLKYKFYLENQALLNGTFEILGHPIDFYLYFEPYVMSDGNIQLQAKNVSIGVLVLPINQVLKQVAKMDVPDWVEVLPKEEQIILHLDQFVIEEDVRIKADKINLVDDDIRMNIYFNVTSKKWGSK